MEEREARRLVERYTDMIMRIGTNYLKSTTDAEDICQAVLVKYITSDPQFESLEHEKAWVVRTTINMCKNELKSAFFRKTTALEEADDVKAIAPPDLGITEEVMKLPRNYRISIYLFYYEGYSAKEIAELLGKKESAINMYLSRGRKKLRLSIMNDLGMVKRVNS
ncbi:MAG: sigma-70 family RNA polymerase sigma factor [Butyrivibrio sp.]|uniref:RNA polymerase sigma factor n=1 Tax=Butyrivibrio sp. TaxID=28121 RepID=UPI001B18AF30|nr:sigma-70 family RNA polymerase sigma factor [Butyrivibrio sp.]MBO6242121.1 sigma-70 family RNA polymerase sigma factor [Butyrivibrio sp.]